MDDVYGFVAGTGTNLTAVLNNCTSDTAADNTLLNGLNAEVWINGGTFNANDSSATPGLVASLANRAGKLHVNGAKLVSTNSINTTCLIVDDRFTSPNIFTYLNNVICNWSCTNAATSEFHAQGGHLYLQNVVNEDGSPVTFYGNAVASVVNNFDQNTNIVTTSAQNGLTAYRFSFITNGYPIVQSGPANSGSGAVFLLTNYSQGDNQFVIQVTNTAVSTGGILFTCVYAHPFQTKVVPMWSLVTETGISPGQGPTQCHIDYTSCTESNFIFMSGASSLAFSPREEFNFLIIGK